MGPAWLWLLGAGIAASAHGDKSPAVAPALSSQLSEPAPAYLKVTPTITSFALRLYKRLAADTAGNLLFSPVSMASTLAMLSLGARPDAPAQVLEGLGFNLTETPEADVHQGFQSLIRTLQLPSPKLELKLGNSLFLDQQLKPRQHFLDSARELYGAFAFSANFTDSTSTGRQINDYVRTQTYGRVQDCLQDFHHDTLAVLLNHIFFKGTWAHPFDPQSTEEKSFYVDDTTTVMVPMMFQSSTVKYLHDPVLPCRLVQLDYVGNGTAFFILPDKGKVDTVIAALSRDTIQRWSKSLTYRLVHLYIPKASISGAYELRGALAAMGIADLFTNQANFSSISQEGPLKVSKVLHKAVLQLDEHGGVEVAATGGPLQLVSEPLTLNFNRPFLILIFDDFTWSSLFLGKVVIPA
uniref:Thyroxine-binding globulin n=1 Tax=Oryctolagus cuniculus TaxID=9986 RepID=A0A5F9D402_RABIT